MVLVREPIAFGVLEGDVASSSSSLSLISFLLQSEHLLEGTVLAWWKALFFPILYYN